MHYQRSNTTKKFARLALPIIPVIVALSLVGLHAPMPALVSSTVQTLATPFWKTRDSLRATVVATYDSLDSTQSLVAENIALHNELSTMRRENFMAQITMHENETLRSLLGRVDTKKNLVPAAIVNEDTYSPYESFVIDRGTRDGLTDHMLVLSPEGFALGSIYRALDTTSVVTKFSAPTIKTEVLLNATTTIHTSMQGYGGGTMVLRVPRDLEVTEGTDVVLPNFVASPIGTVARVELTPQDAYQTVYVSSPVNVYQVHYVFVDTTNSWNPTDSPTIELATTTEAVVKTEPN